MIPSSCSSRSSSSCAATCGIRIVVEHNAAAAVEKVLLLSAVLLRAFAERLARDGDGNDDDGGVDGGSRTSPVASSVGRCHSLALPM